MITSDVQSLDPGALVTLYLLDAVAIGGETLRFHGEAGGGNIVWAGNTYSPWPIEAIGFALQSDKPPSPKLRVGNIDGSISSLCIFLEDMVGARLVRYRTFAKYLDAVNFPDGNPTADPTQQFPAEIWYVDRKSSETREMVEFELASALDFNGLQLPRRQIIANSCSWGYRSAECGYTGGAVADRNDVPTSDPTKDACGKRVASCKQRFGEENELPFGGFPAAGLIR